MTTRNVRLTKPGATGVAGGDVSFTVIADQKQTRFLLDPAEALMLGEQLATAARQMMDALRAEQAATISGLEERVGRKRGAD